MEKIRLANNTEYAIDDGCSISAVVIPLESVSEVEEIISELTDENLSTVYFVSNDQVTGIYNAMHFQSAKIYTEEDDEGETLKMSICLVELDETSQRLDELDAAVVELAELIVGE